MSRYDDIIHLPAPKSKTRTHMSNHDRAAQFAPFAALTGHGAAIAEAGRLTFEKVILDESAKEELDRQLQKLQERIKEGPEAEFLYFLPDERKTGGEYITVTAVVRDIDPVLQIVVLADGTNIPMGDILEIVCSEEPAKRTGIRR